MRLHLVNFFLTADRCCTNSTRESLDQSYTPRQGSSTKVGRLAGVCINRSTGYILQNLRKLSHNSLRLIGYLIFIISAFADLCFVFVSIDRSGPGPAVRGVIRERIRIALARHFSGLPVMRFLKIPTRWLHPVLAVFYKRQTLSLIIPV